MATKKASAARQLETYKKQYTKLCNSLKTFYIAAAAGTAVVLLLFFLKWMYVYNTDYGTEVQVSGWSFVLATISGQFDSAATVFGDIAVPFYYYADGYTVAAGVFALLAAVCGIAAIALNVIAIFGKHKLSYAAAATEIAVSVFLLAAMIAVYAANGSQILPVYCSGNTACSVRTLLYIPLVLSLAVSAVGIVTVIRYNKAGKLLRKIKSKERTIEKAKTREAAEKAEKAAN